MATMLSSAFDGVVAGSFSLGAIGILSATGKYFASSA
jgi:hypothetical protein